MSALREDTGSDLPLLDASTIAACVQEVEAAKGRGWLQPDLKRHFKARGVDIADYKAAMAGLPVAREVRSVFVQVSITGIPDRPYMPNREDIRRHLDWLVEPARGAYDDALIEIAHGDPASGVNAARLFGLDEIDAAVSFAVEQNGRGRNVYVGAALRLPDAARDRRASDEDFYVATAVPIDIDEDYDATRTKMAAVCDDGLVVTTGLTPERRSQHWVRLMEPCDDASPYAAAFASLVCHVGADQAVKDAARVMRLAGSVSYPNARKAAKGYCTELTAATFNPAARPASIDFLASLAPDAASADRRDFSGRPGGNEIVRDWTGRVINGREQHWRNELLIGVRGYHEEMDRDPEPEEIWAWAWARFSDPARVNNDDQRWTSPEGQKQLRTRLNNTLRRLRLGRLARFGLYSFETNQGREEAEAIVALRASKDGPEATHRVDENDEVVDLDDEPDAAPEPEEEPQAGPDAPSPEDVNPAGAEVPEIPTELLSCPGLVGEIAAYIVKCARFPQPALALSAAIGIVGTAAGRRIAGPTRSGTHLFLLNLAPTGAGKNHSAKMIARIMEAADMAEHIGPPQYMSIGAVFRDLSDQPLKLACIDEFGGYMGRITNAHGSPHERAVKDILRTAWGCSFETLRPLAYADEKRKSKPVHWPALTIYGLSTAAEFYRALQGADVFNGFLNRFLIIPTLNKPAEVDPFADEFEVPATIAERLQAIMASAHGGGTSPAIRLDWASSEARLFHKAFRTEIEAREEHAALLSRVVEMAVRLATIRAVGCARLVQGVNLEDMQWGKDLALWSAERMIHDAEAFMVETDHQGRAKLVLRVLKEAPKKRLTRSELLRKLQHQFDARTLDMVLLGLTEADQIGVMEDAPSPSRKGRRGISYVYL